MNMNVWAHKQQYRGVEADGVRGGGGGGRLGVGQDDVGRLHTAADDVLPGPHYHECFIIPLLVHNGNNSTEGSGLVTAHQPTDGPA